MADSVLGKRKRNQVSYAEHDQDGLQDGPEEDMAQEEASMTDDEAAHPSRKVLSSSIKDRKKRAKPTTSKAKKGQQQKSFPFLSLPPELRDYIYELALTEHGGVTLVSKTKALRRTVRRGEIDNNANSYMSGIYSSDGDSGSMPPQTNAFAPSLLAVNKQIHAEGIAWLYQQPLILEDTMALHTFLAGIGPSNRQIVTEIVVEGWGSGRGTHKAMNVAGLTSLADCTNLKTFRLNCEVAWFRKPQALAKQLYRDGHYWFERFGMVKKRKDAVVDVLELSDRNFDKQRYDRLDADNLAADDEACKEMFRTELRRLLGC